MKERAAFYDYVRMCNTIKNCYNCPLRSNGGTCNYNANYNTEWANKQIVDWCKRHPIKTRQNIFLKQYPNARKKNDFIDICPRILDDTKECKRTCCEKCMKDYWLTEIE